MYQTNCATKEIPMTYMDRRRESDALAKITREMEKIAFEDPEGFSGDHERPSSIVAPTAASKPQRRPGGPSGSLR
jgi:hypothetical protein